ncbi:short-chain dehydrogenase [Natrinema sp. CBA1119]|uniref:SDR family oxidoreductase n=1 Tax=Natrinema sp. CBA1119 TaxID=1608465 RepID=UPI000BF5410B|nr:SDR family oxidoreductase [Natrinema sp. CBA1119]PGF17769.1 short-chain dehydrogenase [Natrinema sp. CBA1119]
MATHPLADNGAIVTGASAGIGRETARALAADGADVALVARREDRLTELAAEIESETDASALVCPADVSNEDEVEAAVEKTVSEFGRLDVLVNNAGIATDSETPVEEFPTDQYRTVMGVNVDGMFYAARAAISHLRETNGTAIFVASYAGKNPRPDAPLYAATKWWTRGFAKSLAGQVGTDDIAVSIVNPSEVRTEFGKEFRERTSEERYEQDEVTGPRAVADAIAFAARQETPNTVSELDLYRRDKFSG